MRVSRSRTIFVKLVNPGNLAAPVRLDINGTTPRPTATALALAGDPQETNSIDTPDRVVSMTSHVTGVTSGVTYSMPANGIVVLALGTRYWPGSSRRAV